MFTTVYNTSSLIDSDVPTVQFVNSITINVVKVGFLYSIAYAFTRPSCFTISDAEVSVDWQETMVLQQKMRPSNCTR